VDPEPSLRERIVRHLTEQGAGFRELHHEPTPTSADSARARGSPLGSGLKALLLKADDRFILFALPGDRRLDSASAKRQLGAGRLRFATPSELLELTGLVPGAVPPFGRPILPFDLVADVTVGSVYPQVAFNAGSLTDSIIMPSGEWDRIARPARLPIAEPLEPGSR
jgi:Ala-tRNA(Pro) deacylase